MLIVRGQGGRERLRDALVARGAQVDYAQIYRRSLPKTVLTLAAPGTRDAIDAVIATSAEALENLTRLVTSESLPQLLDTPLLVSSRRLLAEAGRLGFRHGLEPAGNASDESLMVALERAF